MKPNSREQRQRLGLIKPSLGNAIEVFFISLCLLWKGASNCLVIPRMQRSPQKEFIHGIFAR
jgi:hypothetical protein